MQKTNFKLLFLCTFMSTFDCISMEVPHESDIQQTDQQVKTGPIRLWFNKVTQRTQDKFNNLRTTLSAYKWIKQHPAITLTANGIAQWTNRHPVATGVIISTVVITSLYGMYSMTRDIVQKLKRTNLSTPLAQAKIQTIDDVTSAAESV